MTRRRHREACDGRGLGEPRRQNGRELRRRLGAPDRLGLNFTINDRDYVIPMVVEEPSVVAAVSHTRVSREMTGLHRVE